MSFEYAKVSCVNPNRWQKPLSVREALNWLKDLQFQNIVVESGAQLVIDALKSNSPDASSLGLILEYCSLFALEPLSYLLRLLLLFVDQQIEQLMR